MKNIKQKLSKTYRNALIMLVLTLCIVLILNTILIRNTESDKIEVEGQMKLSNIAGSVDNNLYRSECLLNSVAMQIEQIIAMDGDTSEQLSNYFTPETISSISKESDGSCFSAYAAYDNRLYINGFIPDESFILDERSWYVGAKRRLGAINVTDPYIDANTGEMCYSMSKLLPDGSTVVGLDFNLNSVQNYIEEMNPDRDGTSLIVSGNGMIVGHSDSNLVGSNSVDLEFYNELVNKVYMLYGDSFEYKSDSVSYNIFSDKTNYDWYLIVCVRGNEAFSVFSIESLGIMTIMLIFSISIVVFFIRTCRSKQAAENALSVKNEFLKNMSYELKRPLSGIMSRADILKDVGGSGGIVGTEINDSAKELSQMLDNLISMSAINNFNADENNRKKSDVKVIDHKGKIALITAVLFATSVFAVILNTNTQVKWGDTKMQKETEQYLYQVQEWVEGNKAVLDVISRSIAAQPGFETDYDTAVKYLDDVVSQYEDISVAYLCNPEWEHTVLMNNRWEPDDNWHVEERQWYIDTLGSKNNFNISEPYLDEQTGFYCTTLSTVVYDAKGNFIGLLGIDYYLDKLIGILGESYTDVGYAFLTDIDGNILNHPYNEYQMKPNFSVNAADLCYREALTDSKTIIIRDYDKNSRVCLAMAEKASGFKVFVVKEISEIYGNAITSDIIYICVFVLCIIVVNMIMRRITKWQAKVNIELKEAADNAINAGKAKNNFLANMSHEIRTPINAVLGMNEMIMRESNEKEIVEYAANIQSAGRTLLSIINEILDFSKIESGKMEIVPVEYDVSSLINDIVNMIKSRAEKKNLEFVTEIDPEIPAVLYGDDVRIRQVITNILTNAVKYTPDGSVHFRMGIKERLQDSIKFEVSVTDTGIGIKEEDLSKLFTSFQRLDQEKNRNIEGTGLGITIVQRLLNMMDSELNVSSIYGKGSTFSFVIEQKVIKNEPVGDFEKRFKRISESHNNILKIAPEARVLVVDDNEINLTVAKSLLKRTKVKLETAISGKKCIEMLKNSKYDIVFLDHMMPEMDGIETLKAIKHERPDDNTVFIALTANAIHGARQSYIDAGFDDYLSKPFTGEDIERCLFEHIDSSLIAESEAEDSPKEIPVPTDAADEMFDEKTGIVFTGGDYNAYNEILRMYVNNAKEKNALIERLFRERDWKNYIIEVHALKSTSLSAGSKKLSELAKELELAGKNGNISIIEEKNETLLKMYSQVAGLCSEYLQSVESEDESDVITELVDISYDKAEQLIAEIRQACDNFDGDKISEICKEAEKYRLAEIPLKDLFRKIKSASDDFEFEVAEEKAENLLEMLK